MTELSRTYDSNVRDVVPDVGYALVGREIQRSFEARYSVVILLSIEAAEPEIVKQLGVVHAHLQEASGTRNKTLSKFGIVTNKTKKEREREKNFIAIKKCILKKKVIIYLKKIVTYCNPSKKVVHIFIL